MYIFLLCYRDAKSKEACRQPKYGPSRRNLRSDGDERPWRRIDRARRGNKCHYCETAELSSYRGVCVKLKVTSTAILSESKIAVAACANETAAKNVVTGDVDFDSTTKSPSGSASICKFSRGPAKVTVSAGAPAGAKAGKVTRVGKETKQRRCVQNLLPSTWFATGNRSSSAFPARLHRRAKRKSISK